MGNKQITCCGLERNCADKRDKDDYSDENDSSDGKRWHHNG